MGSSIYLGVPLFAGPLALIAPKSPLPPMKMTELPDHDLLERLTMTAEAQRDSMESSKGTLAFMRMGYLGPCSHRLCVTYF